MTPEEKSKELIEKFRNFEYPSELGSEFNEIHKNPYRAAVHCAIIAVHEIIEAIPYPNENSINIEYWQQVKQLLSKE